MSNQEPEPWEVEYDDLTEEWVVHWPDGYAVINGLMNGHQAQLIAAAPEMLKALEDIARDIQQGSGEVIDYIHGIDILKVIAKAKGKTE